MDCSLQVPLSMGLPRQEYWSGLPYLSPEDLHDLEIEFRSPALQSDSLPTERPGKPFHLSKGVVVKNLPTNVEDLGSIPGLERSPGRRHGNSLQYFSLENPHGQRSLAGYSPWGRKESGTTEQLNTA